MEFVCRNTDTRRFFERRQFSQTPPFSERRHSERRTGMERRQDAEALFSFMQSWLMSGAFPGKTILSTIPLWIPLGLFIAAFLYMATYFGAQYMNASSFAPVQTSNEFYEQGEVIVYDSSKTISSKMNNDGFALIENVELKELGITIKRLQVPQGMTVPEALTILRDRYPGLEIDANHKVRTTDPS
jgi:hypothetical protein